MPCGLVRRKTLWSLPQFSPLVHGVIDQRVDTAVGHGQPVEPEIDMLDVGEGHDGGLVVGVDEVDVVREPTNTEDRNDDNKHLDYSSFVLPALNSTLSEFPRGVPPQVLA